MPPFSFLKFKFPASFFPLRKPETDHDSTQLNKIKSMNPFFQKANTSKFKRETMQLIRGFKPASPWKLLIELGLFGFTMGSYFIQQYKEAAAQQPGETTSKLKYAAQRTQEALRAKADFGSEVTLANSLSDLKKIKEEQSTTKGHLGIENKVTEMLEVLCEKSESEERLDGIENKMVEVLDALGDNGTEMQKLNKRLDHMEENLLLLTSTLKEKSSKEAETIWVWKWVKVSPLMYGFELRRKKPIKRDT